MILYFLKSIIILSICLGIYLLFLEKEKMHRFNRYFLLSCVCIGLIAPLISFEIETTSTSTIAGMQITEIDELVNKPVEYITSSVTSVSENTTTFPSKNNVIPPQESSISYVILGFLLIYIVGAIVSSVHFYRSIRSLLKKAHHKSALKYKDAEVVLIEEALPPHSFLNYIFLNEKEYRSGNISEKILEHELVHVQQKHSLDILFIEAVKIVFWFNPLIYLYKRAIQLNHEFLADQEVAGNATTIKDYREVLLTYMGAPQTEPIASTINFSLSKKRLLMMAKESSKWVMRTKLAVLLPLLGCFLFLYCADTTQTSSLKLETGGMEEFKPRGPQYADIKLFMIDPEGGNRMVREYNVFVTSDGEPYTGTQNWYEEVSDLKWSSYEFNDGEMVSRSSYDAEGNETSRGDFEIAENGLRRTKYYENGVLQNTSEYWYREDGAYLGYRRIVDGVEVSSGKWVYDGDDIIEMIGMKNGLLSAHSYIENSVGIHKEYHENGALKSEFGMMLVGKAVHDVEYNGTAKYQGIIGKYSEDGTTIAQERWDNGVLVETLK